MGKPERKAREKTCSSPSYLLRCFGISWKIHSNKPILDAGQETQKKKKTRTRWFSRPTKFRLKNVEITPAPIYETEKQNSLVEDDKQNPHRENIAPSGYKQAVEDKSKEKGTNEQRDINPDPLSFLGYDMMCHERVLGGKLDSFKNDGSGSKTKLESSKKSSRVRRMQRVGKLDPVIGISVIMVTLMIMLMWGRLCAILCTSTWCYFLPRLKEAAIAANKCKRSGDRDDDERGLPLLPGHLDFNSQAHKKKVVLEGFLLRQHRATL